MRKVENPMWKDWIGGSYGEDSKKRREGQQELEFGVEFEKEEDNL